MAPKKDLAKRFPFLPLYFVRAAQLASSLVVFFILWYFLWVLRKDGAPIPWTFILLLSISATTITALWITSMHHFFSNWHPHLNTWLNGALFACWAAGFSSFAWWSRGTLTHACDKLNWGSQMGVNICRCYKTLFSFALIALVSTIVAVGLDSYALYQRRQYEKVQPTLLPPPAPYASDGMALLDESLRGSDGRSRKAGGLK
ncbi:hypothetical protein BU24DRAFT_451542 [Aaosphaeria arxii CBS 175.79]|uniref:MARVEL domain-containing protein n=1 Tax=Aaosphaeria arxii CBS 175.79 TaxID=1450172 RepID=A0A6A5XMP7_9PLEO|nr:uncharacterized protein BU24DRAFT_451542 [Aaosphaeria arxii CBS 175.79]KAF2014525.1 hypothetical protein BU24DRAFT_451542 [Aaosphaeria arxii CBS 175.79]